MRLLLFCALLFPVILSQPAKAQTQLSSTTLLSYTHSPNYHLNANDLLEIKVFQEDDMNTTVRVSKDGTIQFPLIQTATVGGKTIDEATQTLQQLLREYILRPQVSIRVLEYSKRYFTVLGQVSRPGTYEMPDASTINLLEAIGLAGGYTRIANPAKVILKRQVHGAETIFKLNAKNMAIEQESTRFEVLPGDTILVGESIL